MATATTNYGLKKPAANDYYSVEDQNGNMEIIDTELAKRLAKTDDVGGLKVAFTAVSSRVLPATGDTLAVLWGKALKWLSDLGTAALCSAEAFASVSHTHKKTDITDFPSSMTPTAHKGTHAIGGSDALAPADIGASTSFKATGTLTVAGWTGSAAPYTQDLTVSGLLESDRPRVDPVLGTDDAARALIKTAWQIAATSSKPPYAYDGKITFYAASKPTTNIPVVVSVVRP